MLRITNVDHKPIRLPPVYGFHSHPLLPLGQALEPILDKIDCLNEFIRIARAECHFPSEHGLTREESAAIYIYTMEWGELSLYNLLNTALRIKDRSTLRPWYGYLKLFYTALKKLPDEKSNLWRGVNLDISENFKDGEIITWWTVSSCSSSVDVVSQFLGGEAATLLMIEAKKGKSIVAYSSFADEKEVILTLGTRLRVKSNALKHLLLNVVHLEEVTTDMEEESAVSRVISNEDMLAKVMDDKQCSNIKLPDAETSLDAELSTYKVENYPNGDRYEVIV
ncbi:unnamed protein product [Adineta ricciae]|uniref:NAD(P)(+)--arginine ADP-ribosyltransferase n=1 Tax=Adineta ricciae TaxID=249248 RepID=A0A813R607_ADIRI|nr:unnamed protein product [Adineta ricciae]CAF1065975.1 unnamed protein product [Adineta ricciae]